MLKYIQSTFKVQTSIQSSKPETPSKTTLNQAHTHTHTHTQNIFERIGIYQLSFLDFHKKYVGQTERAFKARFKEHIQAIYTHTRILRNIDIS
jgi:hypothetical protein